PALALALGAIVHALAVAIPAPAGEPQPVSFHAADGVRIAADYYPPPSAERGDAPAVILLHGYAADRKIWEPLIAPLHQAGFAVLALDLRGHGESATTTSHQAVQQRDPELFRAMQNDVLGAYDWLAARPGIDRARLALVGAGVGASVALQYAAHDRSVDALACLSPRLNDLGLDASGDTHQITGRRLLMIANEAERDAPYTLRQRTAGVEVRICRASQQADGDASSAADAPAGEPSRPAGTPAAERPAGERPRQVDKARSGARPGAAASRSDQPSGAELLGRVPQLPQEIAAFLKKALGGPAAHLVCGSIERNIFHEPDSDWVARITPTHLRYYSSPEEAQARGLRAARSTGPVRRGADKPRAPRPPQPRDARPRTRQ
ncbi:MAG: alpha/beta fold hydrolase, partial [Planctomycetota bacterium]